MEVESGRVSRTILAETRHANIACLQLQAASGF